MSDTLAAIATLPLPPPAQRRRRRLAVLALPKRHLGLTVFAVISLLVSMSLSQTTSFEVGSLQYWLLVVPSALLPLIDIQRIAKALMGPARLLLIMALAAGAWHVLRGDARAAIQMSLLVLVLTWISTPVARLRINDLVVLYLALIIIGIGVNLLTDFSPYGLIPGRTIKEFGPGRVSFFPNVAYTGILSLAMLMVLTKDRKTAKAHSAVLVLALYFLLFSVVRTATIGFVLYVGTRWWLERHRKASARTMYLVAIVVGIGATVLIATSAVLIEALQQVPYVSDLLLQGKSDLTAEEILKQMYRPWLWLQQLELFATSPGLMGWGSFDFIEVTVGAVDESQIVSAGSEALPTRLLSAYGLAGLVFTVYLVRRVGLLAKVGDRWACACFPAICLLMMNWGSVFHPTDALFAIFLLMIVRGTRAFN